MVLTEFILLSETSAVTVTIAGVVKEAVTILLQTSDISRNKQLDPALIGFLKGHSPLFGYDFWHQTKHKTMISSSWGAPAAFKEGFDIQYVTNGYYGRHLHVREAFTSINNISFAACI